MPSGSVWQGKWFKNVKYLQYFLLTFIAFLLVPYLSLSLLSQALSLHLIQSYLCMEVEGIPLRASRSMYITKTNKQSIIIKETFASINHKMFRSIKSQININRLYILVDYTRTQGRVSRLPCRHHWLHYCNFCLIPFFFFYLSYLTHSAVLLASACLVASINVHFAFLHSIFSTSK